MTETKPFGDYFGHDLTYEQCDTIFLQSDIAMSFAKNETALMKSKWFDYRSLHYVKATYLFAHFYRLNYQKMTAQVIDFERAPFVRGFRGDDIFELNPREYKGFWKARTAADIMCLPYDYFIAFAMTWTNNRLWKRFPRPSQLYSRELLETMLKAWSEQQVVTITVPSSDHFSLDNYLGLEDQNTFQAWLCNRIKQKTNPEMALSTYMFMTPMISADQAAKHFDPEVVSRAAAMYDLIK